MAKSLTNITDDPRINIRPEIYNYIKEALVYYKGDYPKVKYMPSVNNDGRHQYIKERDFNALNMTKAMSRRMASIIFGKTAEYSFENETLGKFVNGVFINNRFNDNLQENLEKAIATGGFAVRPYVENNEIKIAWCDADQFYPLESNSNEIKECCIASTTVRTGESDGENIYYTLLEFHQWQTDGTYKITNELYRSNNEATVGDQVALEEVYEGLQDEVVFHNISRPLFAYFKMPSANNKVLRSPLGLGIVSNNKTTLDNINYTHDAFMWEIKTGKRTVLAPAQMVVFDKNHQPAFDTETDAFVAINASTQDFQPKELNFDIRIDAFTKAINYWISEFESGCGVSNGTFSFNPQKGIQTATQVVSENSQTYQTRESILTNLDKCITDLATAIIEIAFTPMLFDNNQAQLELGLLKQIDFGNIGLSIHHDDSVFVDKNTQLENDLKVVAGGLMSKKTFLMRNYGMSDDQAQQEIDEINKEKNVIVQDTTPAEDAMTSFDDDEGE